MCQCFIFDFGMFHVQHTPRYVILDKPDFSFIEKTHIFYFLNSAKILYRYGAKQGGQLTYRQFSACILIYLDLEKGESDGSESSDSEGTWSNIMDDQNEVPDDEPLLQYEVVSLFLLSCALPRV